MNTTLGRYAASIAAVVFVNCTVFAVDFTWKGGGSADLVDPLNWVNGLVPPNDGLSLNFGPTDRLLFVANAPAIPNSGQQINVPAGAQIVGNTGGTRDTDGDRIIDAQVNMAGTGPDGNGALFITSGGWVKPQNLVLTGATTITSNGSRFRIDGGTNRLDLGGQTLTVRGTGETNLVNTNIYNTSGTIIARQIFALESQTRIDPNVTVDMAPGTLFTSWDGGNARRDSAVILRDGAQIETRLRDANLTFTGPITVNAGDIGTLRAQIQNNGTEVGNGTDMRLNVIGNLAGAGRFQIEGNGTVMLSGNNINTGGTNLVGAAGSVLAASDTAFGTGQVLVNAASTIHLSNAGGLESRDSLARDAEVGASTIINPVLSGLHSTQAFGNTRWNYTGKINNPTGSPVVYTFVEQYDDEVFLSVDGNVLLNDGSWNTPTTGQVTLSPGEHDIRISVRDGEGGAGPNNGENDAFPGFNVGDPSLDIGVGFTTSLPVGGATTVATDYKPLGGGYEVYQPTDRTLTNAIVVSSPLTLTTTHMHGYKATISGSLSGSQGVTVDGSVNFSTDQLILSGANTYTGQTNIRNGANLRVTGSHANGNGYIVDSGGVLIIDGTLNVVDAATPNAPADILITNEGLASFGSSAVVRLDLFSNIAGAPGALGENDELITGGAVALSLGGTLNIGNPNNISNWAMGDTWDLFDWGVSPAGTFGAVNLPALSPGLSWNLASLYTDGTIGIIPEPSSVGVLSLAAAIALLRRRRRPRESE